MHIAANLLHRQARKMYLGKSGHTIGVRIVRRSLLYDVASLSDCRRSNRGRSRNDELPYLSYLKLKDYRQCTKL